MLRFLSVDASNKEIRADVSCKGAGGAWLTGSRDHPLVPLITWTCGQTKESISKTKRKVLFFPLFLPPLLPPIRHRNWCSGCLARFVTMSFRQKWWACRNRQEHDLWILNATVAAISHTYRPYHPSARTKDQTSIHKKKRKKKQKKKIRSRYYYTVSSSLSFYS